MRIYGKQRCIILSQPMMFTKIKSLLNSEYTTIRLNNVDSAVALIRCYPFVCLIAHIDGKEQTTPDKLKILISLFPMIPIIGVLKYYNLETIRIYTRIGLDYVIDENKLELLPDIIHSIVQHNSFKFPLEELGIDITHCSALVKNALDILMAQCVELKSIQEISADLKVAPATLSRAFKKCLALGPKQICTLIKIHHAIHLMKNPGLNIQEIAGLSGFSDKYQFSKCFHKIVNISPSQYRKNKNRIDPRKFWQKLMRNIKK